MMTKEETLLRAKQAIHDGRILEAGFIATMLPNAPDEVSENQLRMVRLSFFHGAKCMMEALANVSKQPEERIEAMMQIVQKEMAAFFRDSNKAIRELQRKMQSTH